MVVQVAKQSGVTVPCLCRKSRWVNQAMCVQRPNSIAWPGGSQLALASSRWGCWRSLRAREVGDVLGVQVFGPACVQVMQQNTSVYPTGRVALALRARRHTAQLDCQRVFCCSSLNREWNWVEQGSKPLESDCSVSQWRSNDFSRASRWQAGSRNTSVPFKPIPSFQPWKWTLRGSPKGK